MVSIETGVDKLVSIVAKEKKIELAEAAKQLNVAPTVVQEWAEFLEEEGLIGIQYSLSKTFLIERRLNKGEVEKKEKEYENKRESFVRRVDAALKSLQDETAGFESIKKQYDSVKDNIGDQIDTVKEEVEQLRHYEELKRGIDQDILKQKVEYQKTIDDIHLHLSTEEKRYAKLIEEIGIEERKLDQERAEFSDIHKEEGDLTKRIDALQDIIETVRKRVEGQSRAMGDHEQRLKTLRELAERLRLDLTEKRKREIEPLVKISGDQSARIMRIQEEIMDKVKTSRVKMQELDSQAKEIAERFETFFQKRIETERLIKELDSMKTQMQSSLTELIRKAKAFDLGVKGADMNSHLHELDAQLKDYDKRRSAFSTKLEQLKHFIVGKGVPAVTHAPVPTAAPAKAVAAKVKRVQHRSPAKKKKQ